MYVCTHVLQKLELVIRLFVWQIKSDFLHKWRVKPALYPVLQVQVVHICTIGSLTCRIPVHLCLPHWSSQPENWPLTCSRKDFGHLQRAEQSVKHRLGRRCGGVIDVLSMRVFCQTTLITNARNFKRVQFNKGTSLEKKGYTLSPEYRVGQNQKYGNINWGRVSWCQVQEA